MKATTPKRRAKRDSTRATAASGKAGARNSPDKPRAAVPFSERTRMYASPSAHGWISARIESISFGHSKRNGQTDLKGVKHLLCLPASRASLILSHETMRNRISKAQAFDNKSGDRTKPDLKVRSTFCVCPPRGQTLYFFLYFTQNLITRFRQLIHHTCNILKQIRYLDYVIFQIAEYHIILSAGVIRILDIV